jgi:hypothetical protein
MSAVLNRVARAIWTFRQPLTSLPTLPSTPLSDLFLWRDDDDWQTYFELTDMVGMFGEGAASHSDVSAELIFFDHLGREIGSKTVSAPSCKRKVLSIGELLGAGHPKIGTFCVLHKKTPDGIKALGSSLAERGYVSFRYRQAPLRSYVHGNLDAVAKGPEGKVERLGGASVLWREYRLQYELRRGCRYEIVLVNASPKQQNVVCDLLDSQSNNCLVKSAEADLPSGGCHAFTIIPEQESARVVIKSRLVMARPLVFCFDGDRLDALHG